jgi:hypothetical protein
VEALLHEARGVFANTQLAEEGRVFQIGSLLAASSVSSRPTSIQLSPCIS